MFHLFGSLGTSFHRCSWDQKQVRTSKAGAGLLIFPDIPVQTRDDRDWVSSRTEVPSERGCTGQGCKDEVRAPKLLGITAAGRHLCPGRAPDYVAVGPRIVRTHSSQNFEDRTLPCQRSEGVKEQESGLPSSAVLLPLFLCPPRICHISFPLMID